jgi:hypothetical protein
VKRAAAISLLALTGCSTMPAETAWQILHAIDTAQTVGIAQQPDRYYERFSSGVIGKHPSEESVIAYMGACAVSHYVFAKWSYDRHRTIYKAFEAVTIGVTGTNVSINYRIGLR